ncbi:hybrid sensor histidine kinase/response regulator [Longibacter salinarum]|nr:ATP-binding protein [Longibacter salinarum]
MLPTVETELLVATCAPTGEATHCNSAWQSVLGTVDEPWSQLAESDQEIANAAVLEAATGTLVTNQIVSAATPERDEPLPVLLHFVPVYSGKDTDDDRVISAVTVSGEVMAEPSSWMISQTQRHRMEALGRMTMGVAHDLNNLLSGLIGHIELLKERASNELSADSIRGSLSTIEQAAEDGAALIEKLQRYIRRDTQAHFEPVDLPTLLEDSVTLTQPYWYNEPRRQGIEISIEQDHEEVPPVQGVPSELREVFVNLILNAVQAMPEGGTLRVASFTDRHENVCVEVEDTGIGMTSETKRHIFEPLYTTKGDKGTGMGLAASYGIVQEHEGQIHVDTEPGEGTTFRITFPPSGGTLPEKKEPEKTPADAARVLVVDDEEMVRSIVTQLLSLKGHDVDLADSGAEALELIDANTYDIVFTDFGMPEMTGAELAQIIHQRVPGLPVILLTGYTETDKAVKDVEAVLSKPFKLEELQATIQRFVE